MGEKDENIKFGVMVDGEFKEIKDMPILETDLGNLDFDSDINLFAPPQEFTMSVKIKSNRAYRKLIRSITSDKSNNWRKLHGFPMIRRG